MPDTFRYFVLASFATALGFVLGILVNDMLVRRERETEARRARRLTGAW